MKHVTERTVHDAARALQMLANGVLSMREVYWSELDGIPGKAYCLAIDAYMGTPRIEPKPYSYNAWLVAKAGNFAEAEARLRTGWLPKGYRR